MDVFPASQLDRPHELFRLLRSFWLRVFEDRYSLSAILSARAELEADNWRRLDEAVSCFSRQQVPEVLVRDWYPIELLESNRRSGTLFLDGSFDISGPGAYFDNGGEETQIWLLPVPLRDAALLSGGITSPGAALVTGLDYRIADGYLYFTADPFANPALPVERVTERGEEVDRRLLLWAAGAEFDTDLIHSRWGRVIGLKAPSSARYRTLVNDALDCIVSGTSELSLRRIIAGVYGLPVARGTETVELVTQDNRGWCIATDVAVYRAKAGATPAVAVGDTVVAGQSLCEDLRFHSLNRGVFPETVRALCLGRSLLVGDYESELVFENRDLPTSYTEDAFGNPDFRFPIGGTAADVEQFWADTKARGEVLGGGLAEFCDVRETPLGPPSALNLPTTLNPAAFLAANFLRGNCLLVELRTAGVDIIPGTEAAFSALLRRLVPPGVVVLLAVELVPPPETATLPADAAYSIVAGEAGPLLSDSLTGRYFPSTITARLV